MEANKSYVKDYLKIAKTKNKNAVMDTQNDFAASPYKS